jgi:hypothetical protein
MLIPVAPGVVPGSSCVLLGDKFVYVAALHALLLLSTTCKLEVFPPFVFSRELNDYRSGNDACGDRLSSVQNFGRIVLGERKWVIRPVLRRGTVVLSGCPG